ncbi:MAG: glycogen synthase GlgA [Bryobacteraceae bacterium]|jgi:1,4-alpha-glucan branching enzyme
MEQGYLAIVLHAHLPYVRHPEYEEPLEENWLYEAITETYIPLFLVIENLLQDRVDFRLTVSLTPTLASMLLDPLLQVRYVKKIGRTIEAAEKEIARTSGQPEFHHLARMYHRLFVRVRDAYVGRYGCDLVQVLKGFQESGKVEVIASAATHGYLPLLALHPPALRTQIRVGTEHYERTFGRKPRGFWLPECGYCTAVEAPLREAGVRFTILDTHGVTHASPRPRFGVYAPLCCPSGLAAFGRDPESSRQVWSSIDGYPGDYDYREFYRDIGHDLDLADIRPYIHPAGIRIDTGIKYYRITGKGDHKEIYVPERAETKAEAHAAHFVGERVRQVERLAPLMDRKPVIVAPYDAELFGHWWFEGPSWLEYMIRKIALEQDQIRLTTLSEYLDEYPITQTATPAASSWGHKGFNEVWLNGENDWIYRHLDAAATTMEKLGSSHPQPSGLTARALDQAARELLLAQSSDWAFMIHSGATAEYATRRTKSHLSRLRRLAAEIEAGNIDESRLSSIEAADNIFPGIATAADFAPGQPKPRPVVAAPRPVVPAPAPSRLHVVMVSPEIVPFAKTGGLADMVGSLALALERLGQRVSLIMPAHRCALRGDLPLEETGIRFAVPVSNRHEEATLLRAKMGSRIPVYLVRADRYFDRDNLYGTPEGDYADNAERFAFFSRAALEVFRKIGPAHLLHAHDWQAALTIAFLKAQPEVYPELSAVRTALTAHNVGYQGVFPRDDWHLLNLDWGFFTPRQLEYYGRINFLKGGLEWADAITTVSPTYAQEIQTHEQGFGLEGVFKDRAADLCGILNGAGYEVWNPATDPAIAQTYDLADLSGKRLCKADVQRLFGLPEAPEVPLVGMVSRLAAQKGFDLLQAVFDELLRRDLQFVLLGAGDKPFEDFFRSIGDRHPGKAAARIVFDETLAHKIEAGADAFLMPSRYEPAGLNQLYSLRYGTIPIVRATGGLKDSVSDFDPAFSTGNGFVFADYNGAALLAAVDRALDTFRRKDQWARLIENAMTADHSWHRSAGEYLRLYQRLMSTSAGISPPSRASRGAGSPPAG